MKEVGSRKRQGEATRRRVLEVSVKLFAEEGLRGVTMREIATAAEVTLPTIYHFFANKDVLYRAVEEELYGIYTNHLLEALSTDGIPEQRLRRFVQAVLAGMVENADYHRIITRALIERDEDNLTFLVDRALSPVMAEFSQVIHACTGRDDEEVDAFFIFGSILGFVTMLPLAPLLADSTLAINDHSKQLVDRIMAAVVPPIQRL